MKTGDNFADRVIDRMDRLDPASIQGYVLRLIRQKGFLETVFNAIQEGVIVVDRNLRIRYINTAAQNLLGIQVEGGNPRLDRYLRDVDWRLLFSAAPDRFERMSRQQIEVFYPRHRYLSFYLVPFRQEPEADDLPKATVILHDVTQSHEDTEKTIESQKVQAVTMLAAGVAHELGNPLNSLTIHLQLLARTLERSTDRALAAEARELLEVAQHEVERLDAIVNNFLRAVRPVPPRLARVDVQMLLTEALAFLRQEIENRGILVEASWPETMPAIMGDRDLLKQAFYNIIRNAVQAMPDGGFLDIVCTVGDTFVDIRFGDTGKGIAPEDMSRIMEPYFTTRPDGTGLGLLIVERIVRSHGGELGIESGSGSGAMFTIRLPLRDRRVRLLTAAEAPPPAPVDASPETAENNTP